MIPALTMAALTALAGLLALRASVGRRRRPTFTVADLAVVSAAAQVIQLMAGLDDAGVHLPAGMLPVAVLLAAAVGTAIVRTTDLVPHVVGAGLLAGAVDTALRHGAETALGWGSAVLLVGVVTALARAPRR